MLKSHKQATSAALQATTACVQLVLLWNVTEECMCAAAAAACGSAFLLLLLQESRGLLCQCSELAANVRGVCSKLSFSLQLHSALRTEWDEL